MPTVQIRTEIREEGSEVVARIVSPPGESIELGRAPANLFRLSPDAFQKWKEFVAAATRAINEEIVKDIPGASVLGMMEVGPGQPLTPPEERN